MPPIKKKKAKKKAPKKKVAKVVNTKNKAAKKKKLAGPVYGVPYIEVDFGQRDDGHSIWIRLSVSRTPRRLRQEGRIPAAADTTDRNVHSTTTRSRSRDWKRST